MSCFSRSVRAMAVKSMIRTDATSTGAQRYKVWLVTGIVAVAGCGREQTDPRRVAVHGSVSFENRPVAKGMINFKPSPGAWGPTAGTVVADGQYRIPRAKGPVIGNYDVVLKIQRPGSLEVDTPPSRLGRATTNLATFIVNVELVDEENVIDFQLPPH